jgi:hypothetical protein
MENQRKRVQLNSTTNYFNSRSQINLDREIRAHIEKAATLVKKEEYRQKKNK